MGTISKKIEVLGFRGWLEGRTGRKADRTFRSRLIVQAFFALDLPNPHHPERRPLRELRALRQGVYGAASHLYGW